MFTDWPWNVRHILVTSSSFHASRIGPVFVELFCPCLQRHSMLGGFVYTTYRIRVLRCDTADHADGDKPHLYIDSRAPLFYHREFHLYPVSLGSSCCVVDVEPEDLSTVEDFLQTKQVISVE